jgi:hypothetical protein
MGIIATAADASPSFPMADAERTPEITLERIHEKLLELRGVDDLNDCRSNTESSSWATRCERKVRSRQDVSLVIR